MTEENKLMYAEKARFVKTKLKDLISCIDVFVTDLDYVREANNEEYIIIYFAGGGSRRKLITGDSHSAMTVDVLRSLGYVD